MGICFSKKRDLSSPAKIPQNNSPKEIISVKEETKDLNPVSSVAVSSLNSKKLFSEEKEKKKVETPVKKTSPLKEEIVFKSPVPPEEPHQGPVRTSSCTKDELDAILIQCGRLSRSSSGKTSKDTDGNCQRRYSGSKRSYDFDEERRKEQDEEQDNQIARPSPRRRAPNRDRSGSRERGNSRERRVSRSPGKRSDSLISTNFVSDKHKQQPAKMVSVPAREKGGFFMNGDSSGGILGAKRVYLGNSVGGLKSSSPRSRSPANTTRPFSENSQIQSLSRSSSKKDQSPYRRNPLVEIDDSLVKNKNGGSNSVFQKSRVVEEGDRKQKPGDVINQNSTSDQKNKCNANITTKQQPKKQEILEEETESKKCIETENQITRTLTRTRSSRRSSRDFDNNSGLNQISYSSSLFEEIQNQHTVFSLPACISKACSILDAVADLNSTCSDRKSYEGDQFARRTFLNLKNDVKEPTLNKYVTVREIRRELEPQESAGSNSFEGLPLSSMWEMNSVDSTGGSMKEVEVEDEIGNQMQQKGLKRTGGNVSIGKNPTFVGGKVSNGKNLTFAATPLRNKSGRALSIPVSAATT